jgi:di/tripeptidase
VNPHHALGKAIDIFAERAEKYSSGDVPKTSYNVGRIGGGTSVNSIPFESWMEVDMRCSDPASLKRMEEIFTSSMRMAVELYNEGHAGQPQLELEMKMIGDRPSGSLSPELPLIQRAAAAAQFIGSQPYNRTGSTNSNIPISLGVPSVTIGGGGVGSGAHSLHEWWYNQDGHKAIQMGLLLLVAEAGLSK